MLGAKSIILCEFPSLSLWTLVSRENPHEHYVLADFLLLYLPGFALPGNHMATRDMNEAATAKQIGTDYGNITQKWPI